MKAIVTIAVLLCLVAPASHAAPQLTCVRSLKCNISRYQGCYMVEGMCHCAQAFCCNNPFTYSSLKNCLANNTDQFEDPCEENPCKNNGYCVQLSKKGSKKIGFRCECHGTGYFGPRCYEKCPEDLRKEISKYLDSKAKFALRRIRNLLACRGV
ncbi:hypothetical protein ACROYT_G019516 [Oculina patagonica]